MRRQVIVPVALLFATVSTTTSSAQSVLDQVVANLRDIRAARASAKIQSRLLPPRTAAPSAGGLVAAPPPLAADGSLHVYLDCSPLGANELMKLAQVGARIERVHMARGLVQAWVDPRALDALAAFSWVRAIRSVDRAVVRTGRITTEGDAASRADVLRAQGVDGTRVVVGVISDGIDSLAAAQATGDLRDVVVPNDQRCQRGAGDEGTALLEIVHDVAPGAKLLFSGPSTSLDMVDAVQCLVDAGADVIVDDLGFFGEPYFEDGPVADAVSAAVTAGVSYHSSAGNEAQEHVEQDFFPTTGSNGEAHDWAAGAGDVFNGVVVPAQGMLTCILQWNDPFGAAADDYDLALLDANLTLVAESIDPQEGAQDPIEIVQVVNQTNTAQLANVLVTRFAGAPRRLELFCLGATAIEHGSAAGSIFGHAGLPSVVAVGAVDVHDPGLDTVEPFSSQGPARIDFPTPELRAKPDLVAFDGVSISNAGGFPLCPPFCAFFGTSAAAPHSAGVAALLLDQDPTLTPAEVKAALTGGAVDVGVPGFDDASGFGRLDAVAAADTLTDSTSTSTTTTTRPTPTTTSSTTTSSTTTTTSTSSSTTTTRPTTSTTSTSSSSTTTTRPTTSTTSTSSSSTTTTRPTTSTTSTSSMTTSSTTTSTSSPIPTTSSTTTPAPTTSTTSSTTPAQPTTTTTSSTTTSSTTITTSTSSSTTSTQPTTTTTSTTRPTTTSTSSTTSSSTTTSTSAPTSTTTSTTTPAPTTSTTSSTTTTQPTATTTSSTTTSSTTTTSLVITNTPPTVSIDDLPDKVRRKDIGRDRLLTLHLTVSEPATITLDILNGRRPSLRQTILTRASAGSFAAQISLRHLRGKLSLRVTATDVDGASSVVEQQFKAQ